MPLSLPQFLPAEIFAFMAVFIRMGAAFVVLPGFGEAVVPARMRLMMALAITLVVVPIVRATLPPMPSTPERWSPSSSPRAPSASSSAAWPGSW